MFTLRQSTRQVLGKFRGNLIRSFITRTNPIRGLNTFQLVKPLRLAYGPYSQTRFYSVLSTSPQAKLYKYEDVKELASKPESHPDSLLIDVREPVEFHDGHIPNSLNIPFKSSPGALELSPEDFEENFGFEKPSKEKELVFYCLGGVRSTAAEELANTFGYEKRGNYVGSWEDWVARENAKGEKQVETEQPQAKL